MSFDIVLLKPVNLNASDLADIEEVTEVGPSAAVLALLEQVFPGCTQEVFTKGESFSVESSLAGDPVTSIHMTLRFGSAWSESDHDDFFAPLSNLCKVLELQAYAMTDNSRIA
ncbi:hypothetical protein [Pseudomonas huaxiensis]|uniref:hypothetical protein n=1 Tax=Pseudomonas huaxiensis TaxID=2213017 RepID=UPI000DA69271|nr:hypothetical protein [Pseudomonas huaxiensis]